MALTGLRLDGQTIGIQITDASNAVSLFSLDTVTGVITSGIDSAGSVFLTDADIRALKPGVDSLFALVPASARTGMVAADALALLVKLCTVSPAADDAVTLSAVNGGGDVWALQAAATAPAYLIAHLPFSADGSVEWAVGIASSGGGGGGLTNWTEAQTIDATNPVSWVADSLTAKNSGGLTAADAVISPTESGANLAQTPDGTATGGNKRGVYSTDWQKSRAVASHVASGPYSVIGGGQSNAASGLLSAVAGGTGNSAQASGAFVGGGAANTAYGTESAIAGGVNNIAGGLDSFVGGGQSNQASSEGSSVAGGVLNIADGKYSTVPGGYKGVARGLIGRFSYASGSFFSNGDAQMGMHVVRRQTSTATPAILTADGNAPNADNVNVMPVNSAYKVRAEVIAKAAGAVAAGWTLECMVRWDAVLFPARPAISGSVLVTTFGADAVAAGWVATLVVDTTTKAIVVQVTGDAGRDINWVATMYTTEVVK